MSTSLLIGSETNSLPTRVFTHWRRFSSGLWRVPQGDIAAAYCADTFPKIKVFTHEGRLFTNCGGHFSGPLSASADGYPLIPVDEYRGPEPRRYTYEGCDACYQKCVFKLGPKVVFVASEPSVEEWRQTLRVLYADGGWFARHQTYALFLNEQPTPKTENSGAALCAELAGEFKVFTKDEMHRWLGASAIPSENRQLDFSL